MNFYHTLAKKATSINIPLSYANIPADLIGSFLPSPSITVPKLLEFPFPALSNSSNSTLVIGFSNGRLASTSNLAESMESEDEEEFDSGEELDSEGESEKEEEEDDLVDRMHDRPISSNAHVRASEDNRRSTRVRTKVNLKDRNRFWED